jgi:Holliday junction resolvase RusA-like endonuclease
LLRAFKQTKESAMHAPNVFNDRPFAPPIDFEIDLPWPPSTNRIWQHNKAGRKQVSLSIEYVLWKKNADKLAMALGQMKNFKRIDGAFEAHIILRQNGRGDIDNRVKAILDWAQSRELILDDKFCVKLLVESGDAPHGCRLILRPREPN